MDMNIGNLAESIMMQSVQKPVAQEYSAPVDVPEDSFKNQVDISHIEVPNSFIKDVLIEETTAPVEPKEDLLSLLYEEIKELKSMVSDMKTMITETVAGGTGSGNIGVGAGGRPSRKRDPLAAALRKRR